jgi:predicted ATPase
LLLIGTVRVEETLPENPLVAFLRSLQREGLLTEIALGPLSTTETASLAEQVARTSLEPDLATHLYHETEGNPLFVVEMVRAGSLAEAGSHADDELTAENARPLLTRATSTLPPTVQTVLSARLAQLSPSARQVVNVASVIGREFAFSVLARACGEDEDTIVQGLDELWQRRIVREQGTGETYDFSHDKLREQAYAALSPGQRRLLHRRVAEAFEYVYPRNLDSVSGQLASHYERAGLPDQAIPFYVRAGQTAARIFANSQAIAAYQRAISLLEKSQNELAWEEMAKVYLALGDVQVVMGQQAEARKTYQC